ncbi:MAG: 3alpha(or 20beta)-hydroxysteroid dehydrogenase [Acidimicrobiaceae bacterium]
MGRLDGKVALISGAARGQGEAEARRFVAEGAKVVIGDVLVDEGEAVAHELGDDAVFLKLDVTSESSWQEAVASTVDAFGGLHVLVNNAGVLGAFTPLLDTTVENFMRVLSINLVGTFLGIKTGAPAMRDSGGGSIVNISSTAGMWGVPFASEYTASKFGVRGLTKVAALELGHDGIRVNSVHPGGVLTEMVKAVGDDGQSGYYKKLPAGRIGNPDDISNLVLFLASDESAYCTGTEFVIDGGMQAGDLQLMPPPRKT